MADIAPTITNIRKNVTLVTWTGLDTDVFLAHKLLGNTATDITVQCVDGTASVKGTLDSNGDNMSLLSDYNGTVLNMTDGQISEVAERPLFVQPDTLASTVPATNLTVSIAIWR